MKKFLAFVLVFFSFLTAFAENGIDLSSMSYSEKLDLYHQLHAYFDKSVILPEGIYHVGTDIKPGWYHFSYGTTACVNVRIGTALNITKTDIDYNETTVDQSFDLWNPTKAYYFYRNMTHTYKELKYGQYIVIEHGNITIEPWDMQ